MLQAIYKIWDNVPKLDKYLMKQDGCGEIGQLRVLSQTECIGTIFPKSAITRYSHAAIA